MLCFLPLSRLAGGLGKHDVCQTQKFYLFENLGVFFARAYQMSLTELTLALTKMAKKEKGARDSPDFIRATTLDARRSLS